MRKAILIGNDLFGLKYAKNDIDLMGDCLSGFSYTIQSLFNHEKKETLNHLEKLIDTASESDTLILYFSGHLMLNKGRPYFVCGNDSSKISNLISCNSIVEDFQFCRAENILFVLDCSHAAFIAPVVSTLFGRMQILAASDRLEKVREIESLRASFLTYHFHKALTENAYSVADENGIISPSRLHNWLEKRATEFNLLNDNSNEKVPIPLLLGTVRHNFVIAEVDNHPKYSRPLRVFLCHSSQDKSVIKKLYSRLRSSHIDPWLDSEKLLPGQDWDLEIKRAVRSSDIVLVCLSKSSINKSGYIQKEIRFALDIADEQPDGSIYLIPCKLEECDIPDRLSRWQWVNLYEQDGNEKLLRAFTSRALSLNLLRKE